MDILIFTHSIFVKHEDLCDDLLPELYYRYEMSLADQGCVRIPGPLWFTVRKVASMFVVPTAREMILRGPVARKEH